MSNDFPRKRRFSALIDLTTRAQETAKNDAAVALIAADSARTEAAAVPDATLDDAPEAIRAAVGRAGWPALMPVQARTLPVMLGGTDLIVQSKTGSGKTGAFLLPLFVTLDASRSETQALVMTPTRELARQIHDEFERLGGPEQGLRAALVYGGVGYNDQTKALREGAHLVIGTPGRVLDLLERRTFTLDALKTLVLDEADEMLSMGFLPAMRKLRRYLPEPRQSTMFSATMPPGVRALARDFLTDPQFLALAGGHVKVDALEHRFYTLGGLERDRALVRIIELENPESAIVFANTKRDVEYLAVFLRNYGHDAGELSGDLSQAARETIMQRVREGRLRFLIATDVAARGIDISDLTHVIQYDVPQDPEYYVHRAGRTARAGKTGTSITLATPETKPKLLAIFRRYDLDFEEREVPSEEAVAERLRERLTVLLEDRYRELRNMARERASRFEALGKALADEEPHLLAMLLDGLYHESLHAPPQQEIIDVTRRRATESRFDDDDRSRSRGRRDERPRERDDRRSERRRDDGDDRPADARADNGLPGDPLEVDGPRADGDAARTDGRPPREPRADRGRGDRQRDDRDDRPRDAGRADEAPAADDDLPAGLADAPDGAGARVADADAPAEGEGRRRRRKKRRKKSGASADALLPRTPGSDDDRDDEDDADEDTLGDAPKTETTSDTPVMPERDETPGDAPAPDGTPIGASDDTDDRGPRGRRGGRGRRGRGPNDASEDREVPADADAAVEAAAREEASPDAALPEADGPIDGALPSALVDDAPAPRPNAPRRTPGLPTGPFKIHDLQAMSTVTLRALAADMGVEDADTARADDLVFSVLEVQAERESAGARRRPSERAEAQRGRGGRGGGRGVRTSGRPGARPEAAKGRGDAAKAKSDTARGSSRSDTARSDSARADAPRGGRAEAGRSDANRNDANRNDTARTEPTADGRTRSGRPDSRSGAAPQDRPAADRPGADRSAADRPGAERPGDETASSKSRRRRGRRGKGGKGVLPETDAPLLDPTGTPTADSLAPALVPPAEATPATAGADTPETAPAEATPRRRSRARAPEAEAAVPVTEAAADAPAPEAAPKRRASRAKAATEAESPVPTEATALDGAADAAPEARATAPRRRKAAASDTSPEAVPAPETSAPKPSRARKAASAASTDAGAADAATDVPSPEAPAPKRRATRKKADDTAAPSDTASSDAPALPDAPAPKATRTRKAAAMEAAAPEAASADASTADAAPTPKRRATRKKADDTPSADPAG